LPRRKQKTGVESIQHRILLNIFNPKADIGQNLENFENAAGGLSEKQRKHFGSTAFHFSPF
jgi:hypothetical protein